MPQWVVMPQLAVMLADSLQRHYVVLAVEQVEFAEKAYLMPQWVVMPQLAAMLADSLQRQHVALAVQQV
ncbi:TPA_asm: hypothetical protein GND15_004785, partial [Salmonella enterica subsp. salamae serovar 58:d:z6]|nr:hypothetical protein [Salmonella enterica subsp. salamae serovar 58:d:z6]HAE2992615.1 hypothetical protein [Salmonella enterica subsp. salamae serovar 58:d:z6]HAE4548555.1 hypothetical protein [Salmonella enterica subsp. salamae serovar 58:d:z6]HAE8505868.1 hypothetical protein [Salmonella enterica subsp. salamae serovar 58:d:z6]